MIRHVHCARAIGGQNGLEIMTRSRANEFSRLRRKQRGYRFGVLLFCRLAGDDDCSGIDIVGRQLRIAVRLMNEIAELIRVDRSLVDVRGQQNRRFVNYFTVYDYKAARERDALAPQSQAGEDQMRSGGTDIDADGVERDPFRAPHRMLFIHGHPVVVFEIFVMSFVQV